MTQTKIDLATRLLKLCNDTKTKPEDLANVLSLRKLHYEIEKAEAEVEEIDSKIKNAKESLPTKAPRSLWSILSVESDEE